MPAETSHRVSPPPVHTYTHTGTKRPQGDGLRVRACSHPEGHLGTRGSRGGLILPISQLVNREHPVCPGHKYRSCWRSPRPSDKQPRESGGGRPLGRGRRNDAWASEGLVIRESQDAPGRVGVTEVGTGTGGKLKGGASCEQVENSPGAGHCSPSKGKLSFGQFFVISHFCNEKSHLQQ